MNEERRSAEVLGAVVPVLGDLVPVLGDLIPVRGDLDPVIGAADQVLLDAVLLIEAARRVLDAVEVAVLGELDVRGTTDVVAGQTTKRWLAHEAGLPIADTARRVGVARSLRLGLAATAAGLSEGVIGFEHARVMADAVNERIVVEFGEVEAELVAMSTGMVFEQWRAHVRCVAALLDQDGSYDPEDDELNNELGFRARPGSTEVVGRLVGGVAVSVQEAVEVVADELFLVWRADVDANPELRMPSRANLRALALAEICRRARSVDLATSAVCEPRTEATVVLHLDRPGELYDRNNVVHERGGVLGAMLCDAGVSLVVLDSLGQPLDVGRSRRFFTGAQRTALAVRDGGCVFPGCGAAPHRCDAHHVHRWSDGGGTDVGGGVLLCRRHHGVVHRRGWGLEIGADGWAWVTLPSGRALWGQRHHRVREGPPPADCGLAA